jgi:hypothetical protein
VRDEGPAADRPVAEAPREPRGVEPAVGRAAGAVDAAAAAEGEGDAGPCRRGGHAERGVGASRSRSTVASAGSDALPSGEGGEGPVVVEPSSAVTSTERGPSGPGARVIDTLGANGSWQSRPEGAEQEKAPGWLISSVLTPLTGLPPEEGSTAEMSTLTLGVLVKGAPPLICTATTGGTESTRVIRVSLDGPLRWAVSQTPGATHSRSSATARIAYSWPSSSAKVVRVAGAATTREVSSGTVRSWTVSRYWRPMLWA